MLFESLGDWHYFAGPRWVSEHKDTAGVTYFTLRESVRHQSRDGNLLGDVSRLRAHVNNFRTAIGKAIRAPFSNIRTTAMFRRISRLPVGKRVFEITV